MASPTVEEIYRPKDTVWVKLSSMWWPAEVQDQATLDPVVTEGLKKPPLVVVRFLTEDSYEFVKSYDQIYHYNCKKKEEFLKLGFRKYNQHRNEKNMSKYPEVIQEAERLTGGDPDIVNDPSLNPSVRQNEQDNPNRMGRKRSYPLDGKDKSLYSRSHSSGYSKRKETKSLGGDEGVPTTSSSIPSIIWIQKQPPPNDPSCVPIVSKGCAFCNYTTTNSNLLMLHYRRYQFGPHSSVQSGMSPWSLHRIKPSKQKSEKKLKDDGSSHVPKKRKKKVVRPIKESTPVQKNVPPPDDNIPDVGQQLTEEILKDWDDEDDLNDSQSNDEETIDRTVDDSALNDTNKDSTQNLSELSVKASISSPPPTKSSSCFDFDDEEPPEPDLQAFKFGQKLPRVISPEKLKPPSTSEGPTDDLKLDEFLEEVSIPLIPDLPQTKQALSSSSVENTPLPVQSNSKQNSGSSQAPSSSKVVSANEDGTNNGTASDDANNVEAGTDKQLINPTDENNFLAEGPLQSKKLKFSGLTEGAEDGSVIIKDDEGSECRNEPSKIDAMKVVIDVSIVVSDEGESNLIEYAQRDHNLMIENEDDSNVDEELEEAEHEEEDEVAVDSTPDGREKSQEKGEPVQNESGILESSEGIVKSTRKTRSHPKIKPVSTKKSRRKASCESPVVFTEDSSEKSPLTTSLDEKLEHTPTDLCSIKPSESDSLSNEPFEESNESSQSEKRRSKRNQKKVSSFVDVKASDNVSKISMEKKDFLGVSKLMPNPNDRQDSIVSISTEAIEPSSGDDGKIIKSLKRQRSKDITKLEDSTSQGSDFEDQRVRGNGDCTKVNQEQETPVCVSSKLQAKGTLKEDQEKSHSRKEDHSPDAPNSPLVARTRQRSTRNSARLSDNSTPPIDENTLVDDSDSSEVSTAIASASNKPKRSRLSEKSSFDDFDSNADDVDTISLELKAPANLLRSSRRVSKLQTSELPLSQNTNRDPRIASKLSKIRTTDNENVNLVEASVDASKTTSHQTDESVVECEEADFDVDLSLSPSKHEQASPICQLSSEKSSFEDDDSKVSDSTHSIEGNSAGKRINRDESKSTDAKSKTQKKADGSPISEISDKTLDSSGLTVEDDLNKPRGSLNSDKFKRKDSNENHSKIRSSSRHSDKYTKPILLESPVQNVDLKPKDSKASRLSEKAKGEKSKGTSFQDKVKEDTDSKAVDSSLISVDVKLQLPKSPHTDKPVGKESPKYRKSDQSGGKHKKLKDDSKAVDQSQVEIKPQKPSTSSRHSEKPAVKEHGKTRSLDSSPRLETKKRPTESSKSATSKEVDVKCQLPDSKPPSVVEKSIQSPGKNVFKDQDSASQTSSPTGEDVFQKKSPVIHRFDLELMQAAESKAAKHIKDKVKSAKSPKVIPSKLSVRPATSTAPENSELLNVKPSESNISLTEIESPTITERQSISSPLNEGVETLTGQSELVSSCSVQSSEAPLRASRWDNPYPMKKGEVRAPTPTNVSVSSPTKLQRSPVGKAKVEYKSGLGRKCFKSPTPETVGAEVHDFSSDEPSGDEKKSTLQPDPVEQTSDDELNALRAEILSFTQADKVASPKSSLKAMDTSSIDDPIERLFAENRESSSHHKTSGSGDSFVASDQEVKSRNSISKGEKPSESIASTMREAALLACVLKGDDSPASENVIEENESQSVDVKLQPKLNSSLPKKLTPEKSDALHESHKSILKSPNASLSAAKTDETSDDTLLVSLLKGNETSIDSTNLVSADAQLNVVASSEKLKKNLDIPAFITTSPQIPPNNLDESSSADPTSTLENTASETNDDNDKQMVFSSAPAEVKVLSSQFIGSAQSSQMCFGALDMDLDINSMPIVIEEDFLQEEGCMPYTVNPPSMSTTIPIHPSHFNLNPTSAISLNDPKVIESDAIAIDEEKELDMVRQLDEIGEYSSELRSVEKRSDLSQEMKVYEARRVRQFIIDLVDSKDPDFENYLTLPAVHLDKNKSALNSDGVAESSKITEVVVSKRNNKEQNAVTLKNSGKSHAPPSRVVGRTLPSVERTHSVRTLVKKGPNLVNIKSARVVVGGVPDGSSKSMVMSPSPTIVGATYTPSLVRSDPKSKSVTLGSINNSKSTTLVATASTSPKAKASLVFGKPVMLTHKSKTTLALKALQKAGSGKIIRTSVDSLQSIAKQSAQIKSDTKLSSSSDPVKYIIASNASQLSPSNTVSDNKSHKPRVGSNSVVTPGQDILAKALACTDLLSSDTIPDSAIESEGIVAKTSDIVDDPEQFVSLSDGKLSAKDSISRTLSGSDMTVNR